MIVYGDRERHEEASSCLSRLAAQLESARRRDGGASRRGELGALAIESGILVQGLLDRELRERGVDELSALASAGAELCLRAAQAFLRDDDGAAFASALSTVQGLARPGALILREPEGYAFYALYPDLYVAAAHTLSPSELELQVIGIRSIGSSLAGFVSAALGASRLPYSVRPSGPPFERELHVGPRLAQELLARAGQTRYVIVDEGPGLSGSSFVAVARWLLERGVPEAQIVLLPSHAGEPGEQSVPSVRERYRALERRHVPFEAVFDADAIGHWFGELTGPLTAPPLDIAGGRWRRQLFATDAALPPSHVRDERRKYLLRRGELCWLMKFVGLGSQGLALVERMRTLGELGFVPAPLGVRHGFMLSPFCEDATPLACTPHDRAAFVEQLGRYLATLAARFPVSDPARGARPRQLLELTRYNGSVLLGAERTAVLARFEAKLPTLEARHRPVQSDNKLEPWEWLVLPDGRYLKCDAEAHHAAHDCIGAQDPAWDVAGATLEHALTTEQRESVLARLHDAHVDVDPQRLTFYELAYAAFRAGYAHYAELALRGWADDDAARFASEKARYARALADRLDALEC